jgi:hypothetical protein
MSELDDFDKSSDMACLWLMPPATDGKERIVALEAHRLWLTLRNKTRTDCSSPSSDVDLSKKSVLPGERGNKI